MLINRRRESIDQLRLSVRPIGEDVREILQLVRGKSFSGVAGRLVSSAGDSGNYSIKSRTSWASDSTAVNPSFSEPPSPVSPTMNVPPELQEGKKPEFMYPPVFNDNICYNDQSDRRDSAIGMEEPENPFVAASPADQEAFMRQVTADKSYHSIKEL